MGSSTQPEGFLLLTLPNCTIRTPSSAPQTGVLALQCVTLDIPSNGAEQRDVWIVLKLNSFEMVVSPTQAINYSRSMYTYMFLPEAPGSDIVELVVPLDIHNPASAEDLETMEVLLSQYGVVHDFEAPVARDTSSAGQQPSVETTALYQHKPSGSASDFKGRLILMDENNGEVMGTLDENVSIKEDTSLAIQGHEKDPVVVELPSEEEELAGRIEAYVHPASAEERDALMQTAGYISRGIVFATSVIASGMTSVSNYYISHSTPSPKAVEFSPRARANMKRIHKISGTAVDVTSKTTGAILQSVEFVANKLAGPSSKPVQRPPPSLPPRDGISTTKSSEAPMPVPPPLPPRKPRLLNRILASTDLLLTTLEHSANTLIVTGTDAVSASLGHKYGTEMGQASQLTGQSVRNVGLVYVDLRGVGRRALLRKAGKAVVKARMGGREVVFGPQAQAMQNESVAGASRSTTSGLGVQPPLPPRSK
ncbi:senescence-associated protein-domain-containing protein [Hysterangium stoloniferum]|nr:senescence-associated protein-domain-containing protein [Hysterangium stoloniferum]